MPRPTSTYFRTTQQYETLAAFMNKVVLALGFVILFLSFVIAGRIMYGSTDPSYVARNVKGQLAPMLEIKPGVNPGMSRVFLTDAFQEMFQLTSDTYTQKMPSLKVYFTGNGYQNYIDILKELGVAKKLQEGPLVLTTDISEAPVVDMQASKVYDKTFVWVYYVTAVHTIRTPSGPTVVERKYKVSMQHLPLDQKPLGLAIYSIRVV